MKIVRALQNATWEFNSDSNELRVITERASVLPDGTAIRTKAEVTLNKVELFSLSRFLIRSMQKMSQKERKLKKES